MGQSLNLLPASYQDFRTKAERRLPRYLFDYIDGGAGAEVTLRRNVADWEAVQLTQKVLLDASNMDCSVELFGETLAMPLVLAPVGMGGMTARRGEVQAKRAADKAGVAFCLTTVGVCSPEEVGQVSDRAFWFQLYMLKDRGVVSDILARAWDQGVRTLAFTIDLAVLGTRYRDIRNGMVGGVGPLGRLRAGPIDYALHPRWLIDVGLRGRPHGLGTVAPYVDGDGNIANFMLWMARQFDPSVTWKDIEWLRSIWKGNLVLKGILDTDDARQAVAIG
ncbi:MAG: alpha-hydroxy-acid oxidizing protein, partial [Sphingomonadales bacterium]|nr:alpha-hydroxy-acid oxidizing protein [Sphingomonadales bacterium]